MKGEKKFKKKASKKDNDMNKLVEQEHEDKIEEDKTESNAEESEEESSVSSEDETDSEDSEDESDDNTGEKNEDFDHQWEEMRKDAPDTNEITRRLAVCNMDWDRIKAVDLLVCFNSFKPPNGHINSVKIYPSEFGLKRMEEEKLKGPSELVEETLPLDENEEVDDKKGSKYHREKLRQYQISRLKYYYAIVDCDSPETANTLYEQLNGMEYESSSVRFDLRFIPDDMTFDHKPKCVAEKLPDFTDYKPRLFVTSALQQVKVNLTWDETDPKRREFFQKVFTDLDSIQNSDIKDFIASASSESEDEVDMADSELDKNQTVTEKIAKYRQLLSELEERDKKEEEEKNKYDIEVTWEPALEEKAKEKVKEKMKKASLNSFEERLLEKKQEKKLKKKEQREKKKQVEDSSDSEDEESTKSEDKKKLAELALISNAKPEVHSEGSGRKKKSKSANLEGFVADMNDPRFSAMYTSSLFNLIPSDQQPKKEGSYSLKRPKEKKFKSKGHGSQKSFKRPKHR